jgi:predicted glycoside hydrolase/deacetylase ChbG (UPF0249 family)
VTHLIVNADDFGITSGVNRAVAELHAAGVVTSATLMARAAATDEAIGIARATPSMAVGCHVVLVDGEPVLSPTRDIPHLAGPLDGRFRPSLMGFFHWVYGFGSEGNRIIAIREREIEAETAAQIALLQNRGLHLTHIDTHKHAHMFPAVLRPVLRAAGAAGIRVVRNPFEPAWSLRATPHAPRLRRLEVNLLRLLRRKFMQIVAEEGFSTTGGTIGVLATGALDAATLTSLLRNLSPGTWELITHPGYNDAELAQTHTRLLASRETEREALMTLRQLTDVELTSFACLEESQGQ